MLRKAYKTIKTETGKIEIFGNHQERDFLYWHELEEKEQNYFLDLMSRETAEEQTFFHYKGNIHILSDFLHIDENNPFYGHGFDGYSTDSFFSGLLVKFSEDNEKIKVYTYIS